MSYSQESNNGLAPRAGDLFRSAEFPRRATRRLGNVHLHLDCRQFQGADQRLVDIAHGLDRCGWPSKVTRVAVARPGAHVTDPDFAEDYREHTPELCSVQSSFAAYLTMLLTLKAETLEQLSVVHDRVREVLAKPLSHLSDIGVVAELERVAALIDVDAMQIARPATIPAKGDAERTLFEVHHLVDLPSSAAIGFSEWMRRCEEAGVVVGGWFQFDRPGQCALRSVRFSRTPDLFELTSETRALAALVAEFAGSGVARVETVVEQIIDIWRA